MSFDLLLTVGVLVGALVIVGAGILSPGAAREAADWNVLIVIGAALGLGQAMDASGAAEMLGQTIVDATAMAGPYGLLAGVVLATALLTNMLTGAMALVFPVALSLAQAQQLTPRPVTVAVALAASMCFITPIGYQTNLIVCGPGNYQFHDFVRVGGLLQVLLWVVVTVLAPIMWPL